MVSSSSSDPSRTSEVAQIVAEWRQRLQRAEPIDLKEYTAKHPEIADELRDLYPTIAMIEDLKGDVNNLTGSIGAGAILPEGKILERLGDYRILRMIGRGGMGIVYEAEQESLSRRVALKLLPVQSLLDPQNQQRFQREVKAAARMHHTNIVPVYGVGEHEGLHYYVMQFIQGQGLDGVIAELKKLHDAKAASKVKALAFPSPQGIVRENDATAGDVAQALLSGNFSASGIGALGDPTLTSVGPSNGSSATSLAPPIKPAKPSESPTDSPTWRLKDGSSGLVGDVAHTTWTGRTGKTTLTDSGRHYWVSVARIGLQVAEALEYAHGQGILHRDIKPSNLLLDTQGTVWVTDFGLAKYTTDGDNLTHTGDIVGTIRYMAPERFTGQSDARGDIYSLGLTLFELITQQPAFAETDRGRLIKQVTGSEPPRPRKVNRSIPRDLETIVLKSIDRDPARRYSSAGAMAEDLKRFIEDKPIRARRVSLAEQLWRWMHRNPAMAGLSAATLLLLLTVAVGSTLAAVRLKKLAGDESALRSSADSARQKAETARIEAEANLQEADRQKKQAEANLQEAERQKKFAETNFHQARTAVDDSLTRISENKLLNVAGLQPLRKELLEAALNYYQGFLNQRSDDPALQKDLATAYSRVGRITAEVGSKTDALKAFQKAFALRTALLSREPNNLDLQTELAYHHQTVGRLQLQMDDLSGSLKSLQEASSLLQKVIKQTQDKLPMLSGFASVLNDIGSVYIQKNEPLEAMSYYTSALKLQRQLVEENSKHPKLPQWQFELANQLNRMGRLQRDLELYSEALKLHGEALALANGVAATNSKDDRFKDWQRTLAASLEGIADAQDQNQQGEIALQSYKQALPIRELLANANPAVTDYQNDLAQVYFAVGSLQAKAGQSSAAAEAFKAAINRQRLVLAIAPEVTEYSRLLGRQWYRLGESQRNLDQPGEALRSYQEARALLEKLPPNPEDLFNLARTYGACSMLVAQGKAELTTKDQAQQKADADLAVKTLRQAVAAGFRDLDRAKNAFELDALKTHPGFIEAIVELEKKVKGLDWQTDIEAAKLMAQKEKKDLFIYFTGSDWCYWCLLVRSQVFGKQAFIDYVQKNFIMVELDFPQHKPVPKDYAKNSGLLRNWGLPGFPSLILADAQGRPYANLRDLRDGQVRDNAEAYVKLMTKSRQDRQGRDEWLAKAAAAEGIEKAKFLDKALSVVPTQFLQASYPDVLTSILEQDLNNQAGLKAKYLPLMIAKNKREVQELTKKQDWDGTILKIDRIIDELKPTDAQAADFWVERARAHVKLNQLDKAEVDFEKAVVLKPADAGIRLERGQFYEKLGNPQKAATDFSAAIESGKKTVESARTEFNKAPHLLANRDALSKACFSLGEGYRKAGQLSDAIALAQDRAKLWPDNFELYNTACEVALCIPLLAKDDEARRRQYADLAMDLVRRSILAGYFDVANIKKDTDVDALRGRDDFKQLVRQLEQQSRFPAPVNESRTLKGHTSDWIERVVFGPDSRLVLSSGYDNTVRLWDGDTGKEIRRFVGHKGLIRGLAFSSDGKHIVTGGQDGTVRLWELATGKEVRQWKGHTGSVTAVAITPDSRYLLSCGPDKSIRVWDANSDKEIRRIEGHTGPIFNMALSMDGRRIVSGSDDATVRIWDLETAKEINRFATVKEPVLAVAFDDKARRVVAGTHSGGVYVWDLEKKQLVHDLVIHWNWVRAVGFTPDGRHFLSANVGAPNPGGGMALLNAETAEEVFRFGPALGFGPLTIAPNGKRVATANSDGMIHIWQLAEDMLNARKLAQVGQPDKAIVLYSDALEKHPEDADLRVERARLLARQGHWDKAVADYNLLLKARSEDPDLWLERGRCYSETKKWEEAAADYARALETSNLTGDPWESLPNSVQDQIAKEDDLFSRVSKLRPNDRFLWLAKVRRHAPLGQWREAETALARALEIEPTDNYAWYCDSILLLEIGDLEGYRRVCKELLTRFGQTTEAYIAERTAKTCLLAPDAVSDLKPVVQLAEFAITGTEKSNTYKWFLLARGMADYRMGELQVAVERLQKCLTPGQEVIYLDSTASLFIAMAQHKLDKNDEARQTLFKTFTLAEQKIPKPNPGVLDGDWADWLRFQIVRREAEALILNKDNNK